MSNPKTRKTRFQYFEKARRNVYPPSIYHDGIDIWTFRIDVYDGALGDYTGEFVGRIVDDPEWRNNYGETVHLTHSDGHHVCYVPAQDVKAIKQMTGLPCDCYVCIQPCGDHYAVTGYVKSPYADS